MKSTRWRGEAALAVLCALGMLVAGCGAMSTIAIHEDAASVPSTEATAHADAYAGPVDQARRLARELAAGNNLPGVSVAAAFP